MGPIASAQLKCTTVGIYNAITAMTAVSEHRYHNWAHSA